MIKPTGNKILIEVNDVKEAFVEKGGIYVPGKTQDEAVKGTIIALGSGNRDQHGNLNPFEVAIGDIILIGKFSGMEIKLDDKKYFLVTEDEILGVLTYE